MSSRPPFRYDHVGSLLRPDELKQTRAGYQNHEQTLAELTAIEDRLIRSAVARQEEIGIRGVTDGEFRRSYWHYDYLAGLEGVEFTRTEESLPFKGAVVNTNIAVTGKVRFNDHYMLDHFRFLDQATANIAKMTIPAPSVLHYRAGRDLISKDTYPDMEAFFEDTAEAYAQAVRAFYAAGCRYLQFDDTVWAYLCSEKERKGAMARGIDPEPLPGIYRDMINHALAAKPDDMVITTHVCRGNFRSTWIAEGGYEPVADVMLGETAYDGYFLEYDSDRAGGFEPLRFLPAGDKRVVLGLVTSKTGELEDRELIMRKIEEATEYVSLDQLCLSPQCGFASTEEGNTLTEQQQWNKLRLVVEIAREVWGDV